MASFESGQPLTKIATGADPKPLPVYPQKQTNTAGLLTLTICARMTIAMSCNPVPPSASRAGEGLSTKLEDPQNYVVCVLLWIDLTIDHEQGEAVND